MTVTAVDDAGSFVDEEACNEEYGANGVADADAFDEGADSADD